jgi:tetratricopeptide (TPR) repeat protein
MELKNLIERFTPKRLSPYQKLITKILFSYFPKGLWIALGLNIALWLLFPKGWQLFDLILAILSLVFFSKIATTIHETGHLVCAYWVGGKPKRMVLGTGHEIYRTEVNGIKVILNSVPIGGLAYALFDELPLLRWRYLFFALGGVLFNISFAFACFLVFGYDGAFMSSKQGIDLASPFIFVNALATVNLLPFYTSYYGHKTATDGLLFFSVLFGSYKKKFANINQSEAYFEAFELYENNDFEKAFRMYQSLNLGRPNDLNTLIMLAVIQLRQSQPDEAIQLLTECEKLLDKKTRKQFEGIINNNLACAYYRKDDLERAHHYSSLAIKALPRHKSIGNTYGSILVELGRIENGMQWLLLSVDFKHPNEVTLGASSDLMVAYHKLGDFKNRDKHFNYVKDNLHHLNNDTRLGWENNLQKVGFS